MAVVPVCANASSDPCVWRRWRDGTAVPAGACIRLSTGQLGDKPEENKRIHFDDGMLNPGWIKGELESRGANTAMVSFGIGEGIESLLSAKDEFLKAGVKTLILSSVEDFIVTKKSVKQAEVNQQLKQLSSFADYVGCAVILGSRALHPKNDGISRSLTEPLRRMPRSILEVGAEDNGFSIRQIKNNLASVGETIRCY